MLLKRILIRPFSSSSAFVNGLRFNVDHDFGDENGFVYRSAKTEEEHRMALDAYFDVYLATEKLTCSKGGLKGARPESIVKQVTNMLQDGISLVVTEKSSGTYAGSLISACIERHNFEPRMSLRQLQAISPKIYANLMFVMDEALHPQEFFDRHEQYQRLYLAFAASVKPEFR